jgi:RHS repeat-associated protein
VLQDHLGSTTGTVNTGGTAASTISYFSFGAVRFSTGALPTDKKFTGQRLDNTGLYYYGARYYDPVIGRFISPDTVVQSPSNPQTLNRYSYCLNNPLIYTDPTGHEVYVEGYNVSEYYNFVQMLGMGIFTTPSKAVSYLIESAAFAAYDSFRQESDYTHLMAYTMESSTEHNVFIKTDALHTFEWTKTTKDGNDFTIRLNQCAGKPEIDIFRENSSLEIGRFIGSEVMSNILVTSPSYDVVSGTIEGIWSLIPGSIPKYAVNVMGINRIKPTPGCIYHRLVAYPW